MDMAVRGAEGGYIVSMLIYIWAAAAATTSLLVAAFQKSKHLRQRRSGDMTQWII